MRPKTSDPLVDSDTGLPRTPVAWRHRELHLPQANLMSSSYYQPIHQPLPSVISSSHHQHQHQYPSHQQYHHPNHQNHHLIHHQQQHQHQPQHYSQSYHSSQQNSQHHHPSSSNQRTSSPSVLTTSSDDREEVPMVRHHHHSSSRRHNGGSVYSTTIDRRRSKHHSQSIVPRSTLARGSIVSYGPGPMRNYQRTATLRSTRSFPGLVMAQVGTFDGEPCPVHGSNHHLHPGPYPPPPPTASLTMNPRHLSMASHHPIVNPYEHAASSSLLAHPVHSQPMLTVKRFNSLSDLRRPSLQPLIAYPVNGSALGLGQPQGAPTPSNYDCSGKSMGNKLPLPTYVGTMFRNNNGSTSFVPSGASMMIPGHGPAPIEAIKSHLANQANPLIYDDTVCCKGHLIVLWIILTVVTIGVISGIILGVTAN